MGANVFKVQGAQSRSRHRFVLNWVSSLSIVLWIPLLSGCFVQRMISGGDTTGSAPTDPSALDQIPIDQTPVAEEEVFTEPLVPAAPQLASIASAELIQSTDPDERLQQINSSRPDPFATVPIPPAPRVAPPPPPPGSPVAAGPGATPAAPLTTSPPAGAPRTSPGTPSAAQTTPPGARPSSPTAARPGTPGAAQPGTPGATQPGAPGTPSQGNIALAPLPELPQPTQAEAVVVTGVVTIGSRNYAIVQSPDEPTGRYVSAGQRVAGGQVLVKRIDMRGTEPVVILEQNGIEISQSVGVPETADAAPAT